MPVKPFLMAELRKSMPASPSAHHKSSIGNGSYNRFNLLAPRGRILSAGKRLLSDDDSTPASPKLPRIDANVVFDKLASQDKHLEEAKAAIKVANDSLTQAGIPVDGGLGLVLLKLGQAVEHIVLHSEAIKSNIVDIFKANETKTLHVPPPPSQKGRFPSSSRQDTSRTRTKPVPTPADTASNKVKRVLREAERRTLVFDLNLGAAPTINKETISKKVTMALHAAAAAGEHDWNIKDAGEMVDDALSCSQLEFLGSGTRKFYNKRDTKDKRNGTMCTVPVRLDFKNKDTRIRAEATLRSICKARCSTPYPTKLRALLGRAILDGKAVAKGSFIRSPHEG